MKVEFKDGVAIIELKDTVLQPQADELEDQFEALMAKKKTEAVVDLTEARHICSSALGTLVAFKRRFKQHDGDLKLVVTNEDLLQLLEITMLDKVFDIFESREGALADF